MRNIYFWGSLTLFILLSYSNVFAQNNGVNKQKYRINIKKNIDKITIDGKLTEKSWQIAEKTTPFKNKWPTDIGAPPLQTDVYLTYDETYIYVAATCYEKDKDYIIQTLKRDDSVWDSDGFMVMLDPVNRQTNGFLFYTNPLGVQTEALISALNNDDMNRDWDDRWFVETSQEDNGTWHVEMAIPFKTLRYDATLTEWGINFLRCDVGNNMYSTWAFIPLQLNGIDLSYMGSLVWDNPPTQTSSNVSLIPYVTTDISQNFEEGETTPQVGYNAGMDAKVAVTSSLNLDLTINPDFSQVEVDQQQTNLTRFNLFFPERRTFFLENSDLFSDFGIPPLRPFFSRRIGLDADGNAIPILFGARLSGNLSENLRIGAMSMQTGANDNNLGQNYSVAAFQQQVFERSSFKGLFINRQAFDEGRFQSEDYTRNLGGEFTYVTPSGNFGSWAMFHTSITPDKLDKNHFANAGVFFNNKVWNVMADIASTGENFIADAGFAMRLDNYDAARDTSVRIGFNHSFQSISYSVFPKKDDGKLNFSRIQLENFVTTTDDFRFNLRSTDLSVNFNFKNTQWVSVGLSHTSEELPFEINFTGDEYYNLEADWYHYGSVNASYASNQRKLLNYQISARYGQFYNGTITNVGGSLNYRKQPWGNLQLNFEHNTLQFPERYGEAQLWLVGPRIGINFSKDIFWTTFIQYNTQEDNFNINSRFQWRFQPMSDLFVVYTDNYQVADFGPRSRAFIVKLNYWLTI